MNVCIYMYELLYLRFPLHCPGPGYWLLSRPVVPPPQSDHWRQLLSGESPHTIRYKKGHHIIHVSHTKVTLYIHTCMHTLYKRTTVKNKIEVIIWDTDERDRVGRRRVFLSVTYSVLGFDRCSFIQEELQNSYMTFLSGNIERCCPSLTKRQRQENAFIHS